MYKRRQDKTDNQNLLGIDHSEHVLSEEWDVS